MGIAAALTAIADEGMQSAKRVRVAWKVKAILSPDEPEVTCVVLDVSTGGARLSVPHGVHLPDHFSLFLPLKNEAHFVEVRWRDAAASEVGVAFIRPDPQDNTGDQSHGDVDTSRVKSPAMLGSTQKGRDPNTRVRVAWRVKAILASGEPDIACIVVDVSPGGAKLSVPQDAYLPDRFSLFLPLKNKTYDVELKWRDTDTSEVGVAFLVVDETIEVDGQSDTDVRIAQLEAHIRHLEEHIQRTDTRVAALMERMVRVEFPDPASS